MRARAWGGFYVGVGALVSITAMGHLVTFSWGSGGLGHFLLDVVLLGGAGLSFVYGGYWHLTHPFDAIRYPRITGWVLAGVLLFASVNVVSLYVGSNAVTGTELFEVAHVAGSVGAVAGLLVGTVEATAIDRSRAVARAEARAEAVEAERERVDRVNEFLRHYVLNSLTVISGYRNHVATAELSDEPASDVVEKRIETIATLVDHVRTLSTTHQDAMRTERDLDALLESTLRDVSSSRSVEIEAPSDAPSVPVTPSFERALSLLFEALDAVTDADEPFTVTARESDGRVSIAVSTERARAVTEDDFADAGPETEMKFAIVAEFVGEAGELQVGDDPDDSLACELVVDGEPRVRDEPVSAGS